MNCYKETLTHFYKQANALLFNVVLPQEKKDFVKGGFRIHGYLAPWSDRNNGSHSEG
jgi:hypothetical protein